ncbi:hypothetical protein HDU89_001268 [Geranomyces variabilis]|nr:hypothetical protein HDU89_001268 [Geranomyces variabilis]
MLGSMSRGLVCVLALVALVAPATTSASPVLAPRDNGTECTREGFPLWHLINDADARGVGNLKNHVAWGKKVSSPCECATSVRNVAGPQAPIFVWDSKSGKCYPKGIDSAANGDKDTKHTLLIADMYVDPQVTGDEPSYTTGNVSFATKHCTTLRLPSDAPKDTCTGLIKLNSQFQFAVDTTDPKKKKSCELCTWDHAKGRILGYQLEIFSEGRR